MRLSAAPIHQTQRKDDNEETIRRRLEVYHRDTVPVIDFYQQKAALKTIDGNQSMAQVTEQLSKSIS